MCWEPFYVEKNLWNVFTPSQPRPPPESIFVWIPRNWSFLERKTEEQKLRKNEVPIKNNNQDWFEYQIGRPEDSDWFSLLFSDRNVPSTPQMSLGNGVLYRKNLRRRNSWFLIHLHFYIWNNRNVVLTSLFGFECLCFQKPRTTGFCWVFHPSSSKPPRPQKQKDQWGGFYPREKPPLWRNPPVQPSLPGRQRRGENKGRIPSNHDFRTSLFEKQLILTGTTTGNIQKKRKNVRTKKKTGWNKNRFGKLHNPGAPNPNHFGVGGNLETFRVFPNPNPNGSDWGS